MIAMTDPTRSNEPTGQWLVKLPAAVSADRRADRSLADLNDDLLRNARPSRRRRIMLAAVRFALTFCIGIAATLAWQPYGDAAREMIASSSPQLGWLAPQPAMQAMQTVSAPLPHGGAPADLDAVRERIDRIATGQEQMTHVIGRLTATQEQIAQEIAKLREVEQYLLYKASYKDPAPRAVAPATQAHKPLRRPSAASAGR
jgi:TRAP-type C4-dicarboxylate transport system permease small subunit